MKENNWGFTLPESYLKTMRELNKIKLSTSALAMSDAWKAAVPSIKIDGAYTALNELIASQKKWEKLVIPTTAFSALAKDVLPSVKIDAAMSALASIDTSALTALRESVSMAALAKTDWSWLVEVYAEDNEDNVEDVTSDPAKTEVTEEVRAEMAEDINQILTDPDTMHLTSQSKYLQWKARNPGFAAFFLEILLPILLLLADWGFSSWQARATKDAHVYEEPVATSNIVYNITIENHVTVVGDVPYYYVVEFPHPETGEMVTGYVSKRNLAPDVPEETAVQEGAEVAESETEVAEEPEARTEAIEPPTEVSE